MSNGKGLVAAAAFAALAITGVARADEAKVSLPLVGADRVAYLQDAPPSRTPLMSLLNEGGLAKPLEDAGITIGGHIEGSYTYGFNSPLGNDLTGRYFDFEHEDLTLNQVDIFFEKKVVGDRFDVGGRIEWIYGTDTRLIHALGLFDHHGVDDGPDAWFDPFQAYVDINVPLGKGVNVRLGKFASPIGYESVLPVNNDLYSHTFSFGYAVPFTHVGVTVGTALTDKLNGTIGVTRGWDVATEDNNDTVDILGMLSYAIDDKQTVNFNFIVGPDQAGNNDDYRTILDLQFIRQVTKDLKLVLNGIYAWEQDSVTSVSGSDAQWFAVAGYSSLTLSDYVSLNGRLEYFNDQDGARLTGGVGGTSLYDATIGLAIRPMPNDTYGKYLVIRPEIRLDYSEKRFFDGGTDRYQVTAAIDAVYKF